MKTKVNIKGYHIDLSEVALIDTTEDNFKITLHLKSGTKIEKWITKINPYEGLEFRTLNNIKDGRNTELVIKDDKGYKAYRKEDVDKVLRKEEMAWIDFKNEILKKWGEI